MSNYFRFDSTFIKSTNAGGRLFSTKPTVDTELPNGILGFMGAYVSEEIRELLTPTADLIKTQIPVIIGNPEINYRQELSTDSALGIFRNPKGKSLRTYPLEQYDVFTLSEDYFDMTGKGSAIAVGDMFAIQPNLVAGTQLKYSATAPVNTANKVYFKVLKVANAYIPTFVGGNGQLFPLAYKNIDVEMIIA